jgi:hypothetical protein
MTPTETMLTKAYELSAAHAALCAEYYRRPRNARMNDLFWHVIELDALRAGDG